MEIARTDFCKDTGWFRAFWNNEKSCTREWDKDEYFQSHYGFCVIGAEEEGITEYLKTIGRKIPITNDPLTDGLIVSVGGLLLFVIIFSRFAGVYYTGDKDE